jgi:predicted nucleotidyltransferase
MGTIIFRMNDTKTSLANALFPKVRQQLLGLFFTQPDNSFHTNEIIRLTGSGTGVVQRELEKLTSAGLITMEVVGRQKQYQANRESPLFEELRLIVLKTFGLADVIRSALIPVLDEIQIAFIYGSVAKQEDTSSSDIDLMLISDSLSYAEIFSLLESCQVQLKRDINPTFYSAKEWSEKRNKKNNFITQVLKQPKIFLIGTEDDLKQTR